MVNLSTPSSQGTAASGIDFLLHLQIGKGGGMLASSYDGFTTDLPIAKDSHSARSLRGCNHYLGITRPHQMKQAGVSMDNVQESSILFREIGIIPPNYLCSKEIQKNTSNR